MGCHSEDLEGNYRGNLTGNGRKSTALLRLSSVVVVDEAGVPLSDVELLAHVLLARRHRLIKSRHLLVGGWRGHRSLHERRGLRDDPARPGGGVHRVVDTARARRGVCGHALVPELRVDLGRALDLLAVRVVVWVVAHALALRGGLGLGLARVLEEGRVVERHVHVRGVRAGVDEALGANIIGDAGYAN